MGTHYGSGVTRPMPDLRWSPATADADAVLVEHVGAHHDGLVRVGRLCPRCGSGSHGRPWARAGGVEVPVSLSRSGAHLVTAVGELGTAVGVDVEQVAPGAGWPLEEMLAPGEAVDSTGAAARLWVAKEAISKVDGVGLARPMSEMAIAGFDGTLWECDAPSGYVAATALRG